VLQVTKAADELGFDGLFRSDHYLTFDRGGLPGPTDAWVTVGALARETRRSGWEPPLLASTWATRMASGPGSRNVGLSKVPGSSSASAPDGSRPSTPRMASRTPGPRERFDWLTEPTDAPRTV
jgi:hypothetical protein